MCRAFGTAGVSDVGRMGAIGTRVRGDCGLRQVGSGTEKLGAGAQARRRQTRMQNGVEMRINY